MRVKDRKWLEHIRMATDSLSGMYPGETVDFVPPAPAHRLYKAGYLTTFIPHNGAHKERWTITHEGRAALLN